VRPDRWDVAAAVVAGLVALVDLIAQAAQPTWAVAVTELPAALALLARRRYPLGVLAVVSVLLGLETAFGVSPSDPIAPLVTLVVATYTAGVHVPLWRSLLALPIFACGPAIATTQLRGATEVLGNLALGVVIGVAAWAAGMVVRSRTERAVALAREVDRRDAEHLAAAARERARIARELHDVVAHALSVMVVQAGAAESVVRQSPDRAEQALAAVQTTGRQAITEMTRIVGLLRDDGLELGLAPLPGLDDLDELVEQFRAAGLPVSLAQDVDGSVPTTVGLTGYRVVQEALTNAVKHGARSDVSVRVSRGSGRLAIDVVDAGTPPARPGIGPGGHGLAGMRERVELVGGSLSAGREPAGFAIHATLPLGEGTP